jgi:hypothetical protein
MLLSFYAGINTAINANIPPISSPHHKQTHTKSIFSQENTFSVTIIENNLVLSHPVVHSTQAK